MYPGDKPYGCASEEWQRRWRAMRVVRKDVFQSISSTGDDELLGSGNEDRVSYDIWFCVCFLCFFFGLINWMDVGATH